MQSSWRAFKVSLIIVYWYALTIKKPSIHLFKPMCSLLPLSDSFVSQEFLVSSKLFLKFGLFLVTWFWPVPLSRIRLHVWIYILFLTHAYNKYPELTARSILDMPSVTLVYRITGFSLLLHRGLHHFNAMNKSHPSLLGNLPPFIHSFIFCRYIYLYFILQHMLCQPVTWAAILTNHQHIWPTITPKKLSLQVCSSRSVKWCLYCAEYVDFCCP